MNILFTLALICLIVATAKAQFEGDECRLAHNGETGECKNARQCPKIVELYRQGKPFKTCSYSGGQHIVCCPIEAPAVQPIPSHPQAPAKPQIGSNRQPAQTAGNSSPGNGRISARKCEEYKSKVTKTAVVGGLTTSPVLHTISAETCEFSTGLIVGGQKTKIGEFPHMAALGYIDTNNEAQFYCGGSLISEYFILTAAHCRGHATESPFVRLGDQNIRSQHDGAVEMDIPVAEFIKHDDYVKRTKANDIALVRLARQVTFSKLIRPACLSQTKYISDKKAVATGWGSTEFEGPRSDDLLKVSLDIFSNSLCIKAFEDEAFVITDNQICAGVLAGNHDTCQGDSGGPLQIVLPDNKCVYHIIGVTSFGAFCGAQDSPSVYTKVSAYLDWIESIVWRN